MNNQIQLVLKSSTTELSLNDHELGIYLTPELDGLTGLPEIRTTSGVNAGYDGGWTSAQNYDARSITIRGVIANGDVATVEQLRRQLTTLAGQGKNEELTLDLVTQAGKAYTIQVRTIALEMSLQKVLTQQEFMLQLRADDPLIYDASETGHEALLQVAQATGGFTIDFELPLAITGSSEETVVNNEGLEQVPTITRMYGALHNPKIINQTTNQFMQIEADLGFAEGDWIEPSEVVSGKDITINGAPEGAPLSSVQIDGNTTQQTYTGKNLCSGVNQNYWLNAGAYSAGQTTGNSGVGISVSANTDYTISTKVSQARYRAAFVDSLPTSNTGIGAYNGQAKDGTSDSITINSGSHGYLIVNATSLTDIQIEVGSSATAYEPYVGGVPAPNPDYPQAVQTVTGENVVKICRKNLYEWNDAVWTSSTTTSSWCYQNGATSAYGANMVDNTQYRVSLPAGVYKITAFNLDSNIINIQVCKNGTSSEIIISDPVNINSSSPTSTITLTEITTFCVRYRVTNPSLGIGNTKIQIEKGSATAYEPYQGQSYEVNLGKNLFDKDNASTIGAYIAGGTSTIVTDGSNTSIYIPCQPNTTYTISKTADNVFRAGTTSVVPANGVAVKNMADNASGTKITLTSASDARYLVVFIRNNASSHTAAELMASLQVELGSQATSYAAYFTPIELCKIGTYQDYIYKSGGKWYVHKETGEETLNSTSHSGWQLTTSADGYIRGDTVGEIGFPTNVGYCDNLVVRTGQHGAYEYIWFQPTATGKIYIQILASRATALTLAAFNTWIDSATPTIYYPLATPTDTEITNATLIAQLEALAAATMYNPQTNITTLYAEGNEQPTLDVSYFTDKNPDTRDELVIDSRLRTITLNGLDVYHLQAPGSEFLMLAPGENRLALQSDITGDNGYAQVSYKQGYLSI